MSVTRILCNGCNAPLAWCNCRTLEIPPTAEVVCVYDPAYPAPHIKSHAIYDSATNSTPPKPKRIPRGREPFRKFFTR